MKQNQLELRREMLQEISEEYAAKNNRQATDVIKDIIATEQLKKKLQKHQTRSRQTKKLLYTQTTHISRNTLRYRQNH